MNQFSNKYKDESIPLAFNLVRRLEKDETIEEALFSIISVGKIVDEDPDTMLTGEPIISDSIVKVWVDAGIEGATYQLVCKVTTSNGRILVSKGTFQVV